MYDIENPLLSSSSQGASHAATAPEPSRHGFWSWKERLVIACLTGNNPHLDDDEVATVDAEEHSRCIFVTLWLVVALVVSFGFALLMLLPALSTAIQVLAAIGLVVGLCCAGFFMDLADKKAHGNNSLNWLIDCLM
ncbi:hypothetical protein QYE76_030977 [Lolium multiflorum]|uniref:Uncharacterized protein n=1 Tax=Lolium multiflorum TaxID=4521 RepID=A0AAD8QU42_LOLMU|nr:hypothetical protein QYE76_030977 [Lolium multiflorum]